jgi:hypothetical protein
VRDGAAPCSYRLVSVRGLRLRKVLAVDRDQLREAGAEARIRYLREAEPSSHLVADGMPLRRTGCRQLAHRRRGPLLQSGILQLDASSHLTGTISGFHLGDEISPHSLGFGSPSSAISWMRETSRADAGAPGVDKGGNTFNLTLLGQYSVANFSAGMNARGATMITDPAASSSVVQTPLVAHH